MERREFLIKSVTGGVLLGMSPLWSCGSQKKLKILVLGGTFFVGPSIVNAALQNNHSVTLFNRGITNPTLFPTLDLIKGDREKGIEAYDPLKKEQWDIVIDVWPEKSKLVDEATAALKNSAKHYIFISSIAVYSNFQQVGLNEENEVVSLELDKNEWSYPEEKLAAELFVKERFKENHTILRGGPIKGWRDPALDILYWCIKLNRDNAIIAPGSGLDHLQFIDVKDIGKFAITAAENKFTGVYNCTGPGEDPLLWKDFLEGAKKQFNSQTELIWASEDFLTSNNVSPFSDLPLWTPLSEDAFMQISNEKLVQTGFKFRPVEMTLEDCMKWLRTSMNDTIKFGSDEIEIGLERNKEMMLIDKIKA
ncbi:NAD-dependent epimerase/dehydratase family protein [Muriicola soli]|uniref:NAD-dependent epimerase/dehydratase family protein n=1 Tax=Muriicola soli TaxID=2507538 RepID=A0A411E8G2_9FLAO|nr:NAD-dependent epimerase/dehydratase family protein [Muriicola soli]QBA64006.1 NAD-dependent epimerase/dehydratase family protein [Muriicola soli]